MTWSQSGGGLSLATRPGVSQEQAGGPQQAQPRQPGPRALAQPHHCRLQMVQRCLPEWEPNQRVRERSGWATAQPEPPTAQPKDTPHFRRSSQDGPSMSPRQTTHTVEPRPWDSRQPCVCPNANPPTPPLPPGTGAEIWGPGKRAEPQEDSLSLPGQGPAASRVASPHPPSAHTLHMQTVLAHPHADTCANTPLAAPTPTPCYRGRRPWHRNR